MTEELKPGWKLVAVNEGFDVLMQALERAHRKGYMPDAIVEDYEGFDYELAATAPSAKPEDWLHWHQLPWKPEPVAFASVVDVAKYTKLFDVGPHTPGIRDVALFTKDQVRCAVTAAVRGQSGFDPDIESAAKKLAEVMDYPWEFMPTQGRVRMRENAWAVLKAAGAEVPTCCGEGRVAPTGICAECGKASFGYSLAMGDPDAARLAQTSREIEGAPADHRRAVCRRLPAALSKCAQH